MRRHVAALVAAALLLSIAGPAAAADPTSPSAQPSLAPIVDPTPSAEPTPAATPAATADPAVDVEPGPTDPPADPAPASAEPAAPGETTDTADPTNRWIVLYKPGTDAKATAGRQSGRLGFTADRTFTNVTRGFTARLTKNQISELRRDSSVAAVVPDERIELAAQTPPTGIGRIYVRRSAAAQLDGIDQRVDADVAIVDTGIAKVADLNVAGGYNCSTTDRTLWRDVHGHGTHVAGTVGAIDNTVGVVGVAPGVRVWAVKILNDNGSGLLSWYVCGLDWIAAQRDPANPSRPRFEAVNMSVAKDGSDDKNCGATNGDILHAAICRLVASGVTVVAAAANDSSSAAGRVPAAYNEVITVSALADTDANPGGLGGPRCYSWGGYDVDDTFADFSNHGSDVDIIAPGKCIMSTVPGGYTYMSGTSMAAPHVAGAAALLKASRPQLTPFEVKEALQYLGNLNWDVSTDPDTFHEKLLDVQRVAPRGNFSVAVGPTVVIREDGGTAVFPVTVTRSAASFERIALRANGVPSGFGASWNRSSLFGFDAVSATLTITVPQGAAPGSYAITVVGDEHSIVRSAVATLVVDSDPPVARAPGTDAAPGTIIGPTTVRARIGWLPAIDATSPIGGYELQSSVDGGAWSASVALAPSVRVATATQEFGRRYQYRVRARDIYGAWGDWATGPIATPGLVQDSSPSVIYSGSWAKQSYRYASNGTVRYTTQAGAKARMTFSGRAAAIVAPLGPTRGSFQVYVDGVFRTTISLRRATGLSRSVVWSFSFAPGTHTVELRAVGNGRIDLDAFVTFR